jgi:tripartite-type tricarboxylate transporter receptor subunit TctC
MLTRTTSRTAATRYTTAKWKARFRRLSILPALLLMCANAWAQKPPEAGDYPNKPIRFIIGFLPGGVSDTIARVISDRLSREMGQRVVVDTRPGAGGVLAMDLTANAPPDGYTWYLAQPVLGISKLFKNKPKYDPLKALVPVALLGTGPTILVAHPSLPVKTVKELIAFAKAQKEPLQFGSSGAGSTNHFAGALLAQMAHVPLQHVPYKGAGANALAVIQGEIPLAFQPLAAAVPFLESGRLKGIAVTGAKRSKAVPSLPTIAETIPGYRVEAWYGIVAPAGTPQPIIRYINAAANKVLASPEVVDTLLKRGVEVETATPEEFGALIQEDAQRWEKLVKEAHIQFD